MSWLESGKQLGWYVNLQRPFRRTTIGIEAMDMMLDIVVEPDMTWRWKDDDEFADIMSSRIFDHATGQRVQREAQEVIERIERLDPPFSEPWPSWRPDPGWPAPALVDGWDEPK